MPTNGRRSLRIGISRPDPWFLDWSWRKLAPHMVQRSRLTTTSSGIAGEYFVAAELSRRGYVASLTLRNTHGIDILVSDADARRSVAIQVKTKQGSTPDWLLNAKVETEDVAENLFFVFVALNDDGPPTYYIVPRAVVVKFSRENHAAWLNTPGRNGRPHRDQPMRKFKDPEGRYKDRWDLLKLGPRTVPADSSKGRT